MAGPTLVEFSPLPSGVSPEPRSTDGRCGQEASSSDRAAQAWARVGAVGSRQSIPKTLSWDVACLLANFSNSTLASQNNKRRLSLKQGVRIDTVAEYVTSLADHLRRKHVKKVYSEWTPATADIRECYQVVSELGRGHIGVVRLCFEKKTMQAFACKTVHKNCIKKEEDVGELCSEVMSMLKIQKRFPHPQHILELQEVLEDEADLHLVMEYCKGGDLFDHVAANKRLSESEAAHIVRQIAVALEQMHSCNLVHRDLKLENVLLTTPKGHNRPKVKVADFGLCAEMKDGKIRGAAGSPFYMAPEVVQRQSYGKEVDVWGLGVILYTCLAGYLPFWGKERDIIFAAVLRASPNLAKKPWFEISPQAKDLIGQMLNPDAKNRITISGVLSHDWMLRHCPQLRSPGASPLSLSVRKSVSFGDVSLFGRAPSADSDKSSSSGGGLGRFLGIETLSMPDQATSFFSPRLDKGYDMAARRTGA